MATITEYESARGVRMIVSPIDTHARRFAGRDDMESKRFFYLDRAQGDKRDAFLEDLFEATGVDLRKKPIEDTDPVQYFYPTLGTHDDARIDIDYIPDLMAAPPVYEPDGETVAKPAVMEGPHMNLMTSGAQGPCQECLNGLDTFYIQNGTKKTDRQKQDKSASRVVAKAGKGSSAAALKAIL